MNEPMEIRQVIAARMSRRTALKGLAGAGFFGLLGGCTGLPVARTSAPPALVFDEVTRTLDEQAHVAAGYDMQVLIRWGDPIRRGGPAFKPGKQTAAEQEAQFGMDNDFIAFMPLPRGSRASHRGLLCVNHERDSPRMMWPAMTGDLASKMTR